MSISFIRNGGAVELIDVLNSTPSAASSSADLASPEAASYLAQLVSLPLPSLLSEPTNLSSTSSQLTNALTTLCTSSYPTFLSLHAATTGLSNTLSSFSTSLTHLLDDIPSLEDAARSFSTEVNGVQAERRRASLVLEQSAKLQDVLELPILADACVRNGYYQEALDLSTHVANLAARFPNIQIVQDVHAEVDNAVRNLLAQLLSMLREPAKLPILFKSVNFLRKMQILPEEELALAFLAGRLETLNLALQSVELEKKGVDREHDKDAWLRYLKKYIDAWREGVHDVVTQYTTIFLDRPSTTFTPTSSSPVSSDTLRSLLPTFTSHLLTRLLTVLRDGLPHISDPTALTSLLTQLTYCATSFARVGLDFRALLPPLFADAVRSGVTSDFRDATTAFCSVVKAAGKPSTWLIVPGTVQSPPSHPESALSGPPHVPPHLLSSYPPIANYLNTILTTLNSLRLLAPTSLLPDLVRSLDAALQDAADGLLKYARQTGKLDEQEQRVLRASAVVFVRVFVPFVRRALAEGVYGASVGDSRVVMDAGLEGIIRDWEAWLDPKEDGKVVSVSDT
ncbi:hypothetical protein EWM64_g9399 [Hericium alpestre]|uniref:Conserved oligomeric Golgi complex subunit 8 n=1 Tax=Hericium alpestre TaxID=135208 RepID=A0A4Y9ZIU8_9AGAM|nr:hypothetical protein EWM64_g9399 [Hericium alpestre]